MQLRAVRVTNKSTGLQIYASLEQWLILAKMTMKEFEEEMDADVFQFIKHLNSLVRKVAK